MGRGDEVSGAYAHIATKLRQTNGYYAAALLFVALCVHTCVVRMRTQLTLRSYQCLPPIFRWGDDTSKQMLQK